jgi:hypothetical protein
MPYEYELVEAPNVEDLSREINRKLAGGWELWGNPFGMSTGNNGLLDNFYCQAMVRYLPETGEHTGLHMSQQPAGYTTGCPETPGDDPGCPVHCDMPAGGMAS